MRVLIKTSNAIDHFGGAAKLASEIGVSVQAVYQWGEYVPDSSVGKIMAIAKNVPFIVHRTNQATA